MRNAFSISRMPHLSSADQLRGLRCASLCWRTVITAAPSLLRELPQIRRLDSSLLDIGFIHKSSRKVSCSILSWNLTSTFLDLEFRTFVDSGGSIEQVDSNGWLVLAWFMSRYVFHVKSKVWTYFLWLGSSWNGSMIDAEVTSIGSEFSNVCGFGGDRCGFSLILGWTAQVSFRKIRMLFWIGISGLHSTWTFIEWINEWIIETIWPRVCWIYYVNRIKRTG